MFTPGDNHPLNTTPTPMFQTPPNNGPPPPYIQPRPQIHCAPANSGPPLDLSNIQLKPKLKSDFYTPPDSGSMPPYLQPKLGYPLKTAPVLPTPPNQERTLGSTGSEHPISSASLSRSSILTPGKSVNCCRDSTGDFCYLLVYFQGQSVDDLMPYLSQLLIPALLLGLVPVPV